MSADLIIFSLFSHNNMITGWRGKENRRVGMAKPTVKLTASLTRPALVLVPRGLNWLGPRPALGSGCLGLPGPGRGPPGTVTAT